MTENASKMTEPWTWWYPEVPGFLAIAQSTYCSGSGSLPQQFTCQCHWGRFSSIYFGFPISFHCISTPYLYLVTTEAIQSKTLTVLWNKPQKIFNMLLTFLWTLSSPENLLRIVPWDTASWHANSCSASQETPWPLHNPKLLTELTAACHHFLYWAPPPTSS